MPLRKKLLVLILWWLCCGMSIVVICGHDVRFVPTTASDIVRTLNLPVGRNETGPLSLGRFDPSAGCRPAFRVAWSNLLAENGRLSVFNTPMYKTVVVDDLDVRLYSYFYPVYSPTVTTRASDAEPSDGARESRRARCAFASLSQSHLSPIAKAAVGLGGPNRAPLATKTAVTTGRNARDAGPPPPRGAARPGAEVVYGRASLPRHDFSGMGVMPPRSAAARPGRLGRLTQALSEAGDQFRSSLKGFEVQSPVFLDVSNATKVIVRNLNYCLFADGDPNLSIRCANAIIANPASEVILRGCVVITTGDGSKLMSNCVRWNMEANQFTVPETFVLSRHGSLARGRGIRCDNRLEPLRDYVPAAGPMPVYRFSSAVNGSHYYTIRSQEMRKLIDRYSDLWKYEGIACHAFPPDQRSPGTRPVYLLRRIDRNTYSLTMDEAEKDRLIGRFPEVWVCDGVAFNAYPQSYQPFNAMPVYCFWSDASQTHFYTMSDREKDKLVDQYSGVWTYEGIAWYAPADNPGGGTFAKVQDKQEWKAPQERRAK
jgi:hypothetical protein